MVGDLMEYPINIVSLTWWFGNADNILKNLSDAEDVKIKHR